MAINFSKTTYTDGETVITASNLNAIQDALVLLDNNKVEVVPGKGLSTNDFTTEEKTKLAGINIDNAMSDSSTNPVQNAVISQTMKAATVETAAWHLGFYLDENGDLCQVDVEE